MDREADVLQHRVEILTLDRRRIQPRERIGGDQDEEQEGGRIQACTARTVACSDIGRFSAEGRNQRAEQRQDQHPEEHRALMIPPYSGDLVEQRLSSASSRRR